MPGQPSGAKEPFKRVSVDEAKALLDSRGDKVLFVDVRQPEEYAAGHVASAVLMPVNSVFARVKELPKDRDLVFICSVGQRSALACEIAAAMGYARLYNVDGGTDDWIKKGYPAEYGVPTKK